MFDRNPEPLGLVNCYTAFCAYQEQDLRELLEVAEFYKLTGTKYYDKMQKSISPTPSIKTTLEFSAIISLTINRSAKLVLFTDT